MFLDEHSVFTKKVYPKIFRQTGIHFLNLPCQTTNWYPKLTCSILYNRNQCKQRPCSLRERQMNELQCNTSVCDEQTQCIPVYYIPSNLQTEVDFNLF